MCTTGDFPGILFEGTFGGALGGGLGFVDLGMSVAGGGCIGSLSSFTLLGDALSTNPTDFALDGRTLAGTTDAAAMGVLVAFAVSHFA